MTFALGVLVGFLIGWFACGVIAMATLGRELVKLKEER